MDNENSKDNSNQNIDFPHPINAITQSPLYQETLDINSNINNSFRENSPFDNQYDDNDLYEILLNSLNSPNLDPDEISQHSTDENTRRYMLPKKESSISFNETNNDNGSNFNAVEEALNRSNEMALENQISNQDLQNTINDNNNTSLTEDIKNNDINTDENVINNNITTNNEDNLLLTIKIKKEKRKFKSTRNMGRKKKGNSIPGNYGKKINNKFRPNNMRVKNDRAFNDSLIDFINLLIGRSSKLENMGRLKKLSSDIINTSKKSVLLGYLDQTAREYLSNEISIKFKKFPSDYNKLLIDHIYEVNETSITVVLDKKIRELMNIFCSNDLIDDEIFKHFKRLHNYINDVLINKKNQDELYISEFKYQALNYEKEYKALAGRNE
jgi:hypothetical protein